MTYKEWKQALDRIAISKGFDVATISYPEDETIWMNHYGNGLTPLQAWREYYHD